jgi:2-oxoglutarate ferredoxin oxidoreductase subunit beta
MSEADLLIHDETDPLIAFMLSRIFWPEFPVPVGVIRDVRLPTHDELMTAQVEAAVAQRGVGDIHALLTGSETWLVE